MSLDYSKCPWADQQDENKKARTERFFELARSNTASDDQLAELVKQGICLEARDNDGDTALHWAGAGGRTATAQALLAAGAEIEARNNNGSTALIWAAIMGLTATAKALLAAGAEIEARNDFGNTALHLAAWYRHTPTTQALLEHGANIYVRTDRNKIPIDYEAVFKHVESLQRGYAEFVASGKPPENAAAVYRLLAATPLLDDKAPVDRIGNLTRIMAHARWADKTKPAEILSEMAADGSITPEMARGIYQHHIAAPAARRTPTPNTGRGR